MFVLLARSCWSNVGFRLTEAPIQEQLGYVEKNTQEILRVALAALASITVEGKGLLKRKTGLDQT
jgi:hypothetical protein